VLVDDFVVVQGGAFRLGEALGAWTDGSNNDVTPVSNVTISTFLMARHQVTQEEWLAVMTGNTNNISASPSNFSGSPAAGETQGRRPVERVRWREVLAYANLLSMAAGLTPAYMINGSTDPAEWGSVDASWDSVSIVPGSTGYRLPTEAQWEFAAKGGNEPGDHTFSGSDDPFAVAWHSLNSQTRTREVGGLAPTALGLFDMSGNVWEWVWDSASSGSDRVIRGGCWNSSAGNARSVARSFVNPANGSVSVGFRLARPLPLRAGSQTATARPQGQGVVAKGVLA